jgi:UDP-N-acetyl-D-mannosaminuronate dehydrogenase
MDGVIVAVAHDEFKKMELDEIKKFMNDKPVLIDVRVMYKAKDTMEKGFYYRGL